MPKFVNFYLNLKYRNLILYVSTLICCLLYAEKINAQTPLSDSLQIISKNDTIRQFSDSLGAPLNSVDTVDVSGNKDIETTINYSCRDSIRMNIAEQKVYLYGDAKVNYGDRRLESEFMEINWATNEVKSYGGKDSITGKTIGRPIFHEGSDMYSAEEIRYNMKSGKGIIKGIVTRQGDGYIQGGPVKKTPEAIYVKNAFYTTCNLPHPHYSINASRLKVIPNDKVVTGPFHLEVMGIPLPVGLPLGFFPVSRRSKSGVIIPTIGEQRSRGLFLSQGGYYWAVNDYVGIKLVGDVYANKSYRLTGSANYVKKYGYSGATNLNYSRVKDGFDDVSNIPELYSVRWNHNTIGNRPSRFTADVNISSGKYYQQNSYNPVSYQSTNFASNVSWFKTFRNSPFSLGVSFRQSQNTQTKIMTVDAPDVALNMSRIYIFKRKNSDGSRWFEKINFSYTGVTRYSVTNSLRDVSIGGELIGDTIVNVNSRTFQLILDEGKWGMRHSIPISTTFKVFKYFSLNPTFNYNQWWYADKLEYKDVYDSINKRHDAVGTKTPGFNIAQSFDMNVSLTTRVYGLYRIKNRVLKAVRHTMIPTMSYRYQPDASGNSNYFYKSENIRSGNGDLTPFSVYQNSLYGGPNAGTSNTLSFSLQNTLEGKVRNRKDTTGASNAAKRVKLLENLSIAGNYNFTADSLKLSVIQLNARSRFFDKIDFNFTSNFDPYTYVLDSARDKTVYQRRVNTFAFDQYNKLAIMTGYNISLSTNLNPQGQKSQKPAALNNPNAPTYVVGGDDQYVDFNIPWNLFVSYNINYNKFGFAESSYTQALTFNGDINLSENWKIKATSGYDLLKNSLTYTTIQLFRDLHCWQMSLNVVPFGQRQSFFFTINAKSSLLRDLKVNKQSSTYFGNGY